MIHCTARTNDMASQIQIQEHVFLFPANKRRSGASSCLYLTAWGDAQELELFHVKKAVDSSCNSNQFNSESPLIAPVSVAAAVFEEKEELGGHAGQHSPQRARLVADVREPGQISTNAQISTRALMCTCPKSGSCQ
eukprot:3941857-Rhodomonas_salina.2